MEDEFGKDEFIYGRNTHIETNTLTESCLVIANLLVHLH